MTIAFVSTIRKPWGGSEELWACCAQKALLENYKIIISAYDCGKLFSKTQKLIDQGVTLDLRIGDLKKKTDKILYLIKRIKRAYQKKLGNQFYNLLKKNPDFILYIGTAYSIANDYKLIQLIYRKKIPFFINVQLNYEYEENKISEKNKKLVRSAYNVCETVFFVSERNKVSAEKQLSIKIFNSAIVRNPVNISSTEILPYPENDIMQFATVGNLICIHKGQDILLDVLSAGKWTGRNWHLNIYGTGEDEGFLKQAVIKNQLQNKVTFHGRVSDIRAVWKQNNILIMPSRMEGMPLAVVEAMICGRPVVATDVGGITEWIENNVEGFIALRATVESISEALENAWSRQADWKEMGKLAHAKALKLYDPDPGSTLLNLMTKQN